MGEVRPRVVTEYHMISNTNRHKTIPGDLLALGEFVPPPWPYGQNLCNVRLFFRGLRDDDPSRSHVPGVHSLHKDPVVHWPDVHTSRLFPGITGAIR